MAKRLKNLNGFKKVVVEVSRCQNTTKTTLLQNGIANYGQDLPKGYFGLKSYIYTVITLSD